MKETVLRKVTFTATARHTNKVGYSDLQVVGRNLLVRIGWRIIRSIWMLQVICHFDDLQPDWAYDRALWILCVGWHFVKFPSYFHQTVFPSHKINIQFMNLNSNCRNNMKFILGWHCVMSCSFFVIANIYIYILSYSLKRLKGKHFDSYNSSFLLRHYHSLRVIFRRKLPLYYILNKPGHKLFYKNVRF